MFLALSTYTVPLAQVDALRDAHKRWLDGLEGEGRVVLAGRQEPATGGVVVLRAADRAQAEATLAADPYVTAGVAAYSLTEFESLRGAATG